MKNKAAKKLKAHKAFMKGVESSWSVIDPLAEKHELLNTNLRHQNPVKNIMLATDPSLKIKVYDSLLQQSFKWRVEINMEFDDGEHVYIKPRVFVIICRIQGADDTWAQTIEELFAGANMKHYTVTHIRCTVLDAAPIKDEDFA